MSLPGGFEHATLTVRRLMISTLGLFIPAMRAVKETLYQSERAWVVATVSSPERLGDGRPNTSRQFKRMNNPKSSA
jgi:hypothetical protein